MPSLTVLIVDDDLYTRQALLRILVVAGHSAFLASDVTSARRLLAHQHFDVVITSVLLGSENGSDVIRAARAMSPETGVVVMSAGANFLELWLKLVLGPAADACVPLVKPFGRDEVLAAVEAAAGWFVPTAA